MAAVSLSCYPL